MDEGQRQKEHRIVAPGFQLDLGSWSVRYVRPAQREEIVLPPPPRGDNKVREMAGTCAEIDETSRNHDVCLTIGGVGRRSRGCVGTLHAARGTNLLAAFAYLCVDLRW